MSERGCGYAPARLEAGGLLETNCGRRILRVISRARRPWRYLRFAISDLVFCWVIQYSETYRGLTFAVRVVPRAARSEIVGEYSGALRIRLSAPPVEGAANRELVRTLAKIFKLPQNAVEIISGVNSKNKVVRVLGASAATLEKIILSK